jgi:riboflavin synthase
MFTGIIEDLGTVLTFDRLAGGARLRVHAPKFTVIPEGMSIAVNGACLTAVDIHADSFAADLAPETLARTNLGYLQAGSRVNLERPVTPTTFLSGHIVQGHVDATTTLVSLTALGDGNWWLTVRVPPALERYLVHKGSIAIDGISLTIAELKPAELKPAELKPAELKPEELSVTIIPHTYEHTTLSTAKPGSRLNIEVDVLAKYVEKLLKSASAPAR